MIDARERARARGSPCNAETPRERVEEDALLAPSCRLLLSREMDRGMSARARERALRLGRTIADLAGEERVYEEHLEEAFAFRPSRERLG